MNCWSWALASVVGLSLTVGCGGGGLRGPRGKVCAEEYNPIPIDLQGPEKVDLDGVNSRVREYPGTYTYEGAEVYYSDSKTGVKIHVAETRSARKPTEFDKSNVCMAHITPDMSDKLQF